jgi:peptidoglycan/LPS O-acetylase OafA/YrhL
MRQTMTAPTNDRNRGARIDVLTGWRAVAAYSVLLAHAIDASFFYGGVPIFHPFDARLAYFGMSLFFVLSGFVIQYNYADIFLKERLPTAVRVFLVARFARLYPLYAMSIIFWPKPRLTEYTGTIFAYATLTQSWFNVQMAIFPPDWSISTEWFFYFAFIPLVFLIAGITRPLFVTAVFLLATLAILATVFLYAEAPLIELTRRWLWTDKLVSASPEEWLRYFSPFVRMLEFALGVLTAKIYSQWKDRSHSPPVWARAAIVLAGSWCLIVMLIPAVSENPVLEKFKSNFIYAPAIATLLLLTCVFDTRLSRFLSSRYVVAGGEISYSVYVWSFFVLLKLGAVLSFSSFSFTAAIGGTVKVLICVVLTTLVALLSFYLIETPSRKWIRAVLMPSRAR